MIKTMQTLRWPRNSDYARSQSASVCRSNLCDLVTGAFFGSQMPMKPLQKAQAEGINVPL
jgi:hypothetical protein